MDAQPEAKTDSSCPAVDLSEDSDGETSQDESPPVPKWNELSIIERVGLNSVEMSEKDLEVAFAQIAMAFHCDQYTLKQRLQAEEHARNLAEENIQLELSRGRETLETLKGLCIDSQRSRILQRLELSLDILAGTVERISNTAEVLGAVHQEARVSRAVELMLAHVENLRRQHDKNVSDLEEAKKLIQQSILSPRACSDPEDSDSRMRSFQQNSSRRRVSMSLISRESQVIKRHLKKRVTQSTKKPGRSGSPSSESSCSVLTKEDNCLVDDRPANPDDPASAPPPPAQSSIPDPDHLPKHPSSRKMQRKKYKKASYSLQQTPRSLNSMLFCCFSLVFSSLPSQRAKTELYICVPVSVHLRLLCDRGTGSRPRSPGKRQTKINGVRTFTTGFLWASLDQCAGDLWPSGWTAAGGCSSSSTCWCFSAS